MPKQLTSLEDLQQAEGEDRDRKARLALIDEELALYHPDGSWRFMEKRLQDLETQALEALVYCPEPEVLKYRARLGLIRHLLTIREVLMEERARLQQEMNDE